jgi:hypothetical protein
MIEHDFRFLPLGSFITLKDHANQIFIIVARAVVKNESSILSSTYRLAEYPLGDTPDSKPLFARDSQVVAIIHEGYSDKLDEEFLESTINEAKTRASVKAKPVVEDIIEPNFTQLLDTGKITVQTATITSTDQEVSVGKLRKEPFYKFGLGEDTDSHEN